jgi:acetylornithine deacetylase/succinyl-diaminopimelate desuccinylase-like protein
MLAHPRIDVLVDPVLPDRPNLIARVRGTGGEAGLLLNAHLDSGYVDTTDWRRDPLEPWVESGRLFGGGVSDMLGGLASMVEVLRVVADGSPIKADLVLLASMHHDSNGVGTKYALATDREWPSFAINGEPTGLSMISMHGGCIRFEISFAGRTAHVSRAELGHDALQAATETIMALKKTGLTAEPFPELSTLPKLNIGMVEAGSSPGTIAADAVVRGEVRTVPGMSWEGVKRDLVAAATRSCPAGVTAAIHCLVRQRPFIGRRHGPLAEALASAHASVRGQPLEIDVNTAAQSFATDAPDLAAFGMDTVVYGPGEWHLVANESVAIAELAEAARVYVATLLNLAEDE